MSKLYILCGKNVSTKRGTTQAIITDLFWFKDQILKGLPSVG